MVCPLRSTTADSKRYGDTLSHLYFTDTDHQADSQMAYLSAPGQYNTGCRLLVVCVRACARVCVCVYVCVRVGRRDNTTKSLEAGFAQTCMLYVCLEASRQSAAVSAAITPSLPHSLLLSPLSSLSPPSLFIPPHTSPLSTSRRLTYNYW